MKMRESRKRVMALSGEIAGKFRAGGVTVRGMMLEYLCGYDVLMDAVFEEMSMDEWKGIVRGSKKAGGDKRRKKNRQ